METQSNQNFLVLLFDIFLFSGSVVSPGCHALADARALGRMLERGVVSLMRVVTKLVICKSLNLLLSNKLAGLKMQL